MSSASGNAASSGGLFRFGLGPAIIAGAAWIIFWNEGGEAKTQARLAEGAGAVVSVAADKADPANEGKLVHVVGEVKTDESLRDPELMVSLPAIRLKRDVQVYQWQETEQRRENPNEPDGKAVPPTITYEYNKVWSSDPIKSADFKEPMGHSNPPILLSGDEWKAERVTLGAFELTGAQKGKLSANTPVALTEKQANVSLPGTRGKSYRSEDQLLLRPNYAAADGPKAKLELSDRPPEVLTEQILNDPQIGDIRVKYYASLPKEMTAIGKQVGNTIVPYEAKAGGFIDKFLSGRESPEQLFSRDKAWSSNGTWIFRVISLAIIYVGVFLTMAPLTMYAASITWLQPIVAAGAFYIRAGLTLAIAAALIGAAWLYYRPALAITLFVIAGVLLFGTLCIVWSVSRRRTA
ncbi:TMEM43 family protein [Anatilimnocola floriformis]|uniref:TMEM43 family protein n=1 Tax=Anatilimnocola floriformis TaxID=2948575 RepID=UPI0020C33A73|nr:TMEM43 family protein [Anatilimnocola floriformis]